MNLERTPIPGLLLVRLDVHEDSRGWFKESWQHEKMVAAGLPDFGPVQHNVSLNARRGTTRGIHTEPWDKFVTVTTGAVFGAWVDMRQGPGFGATFWVEIDPSVAVFVPRGVGNSYQTLADGTTYSYLVNDHWRPGQAYPALDLADPTAAIPWPIPLADCEISEKDHANPRLDAVTAMAPRRVLITGANGQLARALAAEFPEAHTVTRAQLDVTDEAAVAAWPWQEYATILHTACYTAVDEAESPAGRVDAWITNAAAPAALARAAQQHGLTIVHYSTDYVFDGSVEVHDESEPLSPLGVYGQSKAAGDLAVAAAADHHYLLRTSWLVGDGTNFVRTMRDLAARGVAPAVVDDQRGRLTFSDELARATRHLLETGAAYGTYNVTNAGEPMSWWEVARAVFALSGRSPDDVTPISTEAYAAGRTLSPRPRSSVLSLAKLEATGFEPEDAGAALRRYCVNSSRAASESTSSPSWRP